MSGRRAGSNRGLTARLLLMVAGSFAFGFALVSLYDVFCEVAGIGSRERLTRAATVGGGATAEPRTIVVEFTASVPAGGRWEFAPVESSMEVRTGQLYETHYRAKNLSGGDVTGQAVPSVAPFASGVAPPPPPPSAAPRSMRRFVASPTTATPVLWKRPTTPLLFPIRAGFASKSCAVSPAAAGQADDVPPSAHVPPPHCAQMTSSDGA
jgi:hypothetical protein